ncbi:MAG: hypothetical protein IJP71_01135 [Lachnospiraceae bacterium]|nr:hypothetical protein [Lachnospiraceae bacterium]
MRFILNNRKVVALLLIVSMIFVNAGTQTFAVSFSKVMSKTLEGMEQPEDISTRYYEEFYYESRTYLLNDSDSFDDEIFDNENVDDDSEKDDSEKDDSKKGDSEEIDQDREEKLEKENIDKKDDIDEDDEKSNDDRVKYEEEPEEDAKENAEENVDKENVDDEATEEEKQESEEEKQESEEEKQESEEEITEDEEEKKEDKEESINESLEESSEESKKESSEENIENKSEETQVTETVNEETTVASSSEADEVIEEEKIEASEQGVQEDVEVASTSEIISLKKIASVSVLELAEEKIFGAPGDPDWSGEHVHKECGVASGSDCVHTEYAAHGIDDGLDYKKLEFDDHYGEFIDIIAGFVDDGSGGQVAVDHPEYYYLTEDVTFNQNDDTAPRDQGTAFYAIDLQRDLYLCLNGHTLTNFTFKSTGNYKLIITDCAGGGTIKSVEEEALMFQLPVQIFGLVDKIKVNATRIVYLQEAVRALNTTFYNVVFDGTDCPSFDYSDDAQDQMIRLYYNNTSLNLKFENCDIANWGKVTGSSDVNSTGNMLLRFYTTGTVTFNNVNVYNNVGLRQNLLYVDNSTKITFKGRNEFYNNVIDGTNTGNPSIFNFIGSSVVRVQGEGLYIHDNKSLKTNAPGVFFHMDASGSFQVDEGATLAVDNNKVVKLQSSNNTVIFNVNKTFNCYGNLSITNNKVINCGESTTGTYIAAVRIFNNKQIKLGDGVVTINGNKSYKDDEVTAVEDGIYRNHHMTEVYADTKDINCLFEMISGKKFNSANRIEGIGFPNGQVGKIMKWTSAEVDDLSIVSTVFKADNFYFPDYEVGVVSDYAKPVHNQTHRHKICGVAEGVACTHTAEIATHNEVVGYSGIRSEFTAANSIALLKGLATTDAEERLYLTEDIICDTVTNISLNRTVYLCLNGHSIKNIYFNTGNKNNVKLYITNCGAPAEFSSDNVLGHMFNCWVQAFGVNRNIKVKSMRGYIASYAVYNGSAFYSVEFDGTDAPSQDAIVFSVNVDNVTITLYDVVINNYNVVGGNSGSNVCYFNKKSTINIRDLKVHDNAGFQSIVNIGNDSGGTTVNFNGVNEIYNNKSDNHNGNNKRMIDINYGIVSVNGTLDIHDNYASGNQIILLFAGNNTFTVNEGATFKLNNNILENEKKNMHIIDLNDNANDKVNILGNMEVIGNKVYNCNVATTGERIVALYKGDKATLTLGSGKITVKDNAAYSDEGVTPADDITYKGYHMYQVQSFLPEVGALFNMAAGKKFNPENRIEGISFRNGQTGNIIKWTSDEVDDPSIISTVFTADTFLANFTVGVSGDYAVLISDDNHKHKICGIASTATCTHTETAAHTDVANYTKLNDSLAFDTKVNMIAGLSASESPAYLFLENDLTSDALTTINLKRNVYICLNGYNMTNIRFTGDGKKIFITNCQDTKSVITEISSYEFVLRLNSEVYGKKVAGEYNLGINAYCVGLSYSSTSTEAKFYCVDVDGANVVGASGRSRFYLQNAGTIILEDVRIRDLNTASQVTFNHEGANGTLILKNIEMRNISYMNMGFIRVNGANRYLILKGYNKIHSNNITSNSGNSMEHMIHINNGKMTLEEGSTLEICDNVIPRHPNSNMFILSTYTASTGAIDARPGSTIYIHDNAMYKAIKDNGIIGLFKNNTEQNLLGNIRIENNKFYNCNSSNTGGDYIAGLSIANGVTTNIGTGSIIIKDNNAYSDEGVTPAGNTYYAHHVYGVMSGNADLIFTQTAGTKFNTNSRIENIGFKGAVTGKILKWTSDTVDVAELGKFSECFTADTYFVDDYVVKRKGDYVVVASFDEHEHKVCGVASNSVCLHTEIATHSEYFSYSKIDSAALSNVDNFIKIFTGTSDTSGELYVYLSGDITVTSVKAINPTRPVNLCLNGHMMSGFRFIGSNKVTITNCKPEMGTFKEILDTNICFQANTYLFGINKNLKINTSRIMDIGGGYATTNTEAMFYGTIFDGTGMNTGSASSNSKFFFDKNNATAIFENCTFTNFRKQGRMFWFSGGNSASRAVFKNVDVINNSNTDYQFFTSRAGMNFSFKGRNNFLNNSMNSQSDSYRVFEFTNTAATINIEDEGLYIDNTATSGNKYSVMFFSNGKLTVAERATLSITNNIIATKMNNGVNYMCEFQGSNTVIKGNLEITGNKIRNCGTNNTSYIAALRLYNPITIGSGKIVVENNRAYKDSATLADDTAYPAQHMYQVLAQPSTNAIFNMADGAKLNPESKLNGIAIYSADSRGKILEWNDTTYTDEGDHTNVFIPDPFLNEYIGECVEDGYARLEYRDIPEERHIHMACGRVHGVASCSHTEAAEHTENLEYHKIGANVLKYRFTDLMAAADGGKPMYFCLDKNLSGSDTQITLNNDLYICLSGFSMTGYRFYSTNGSTVHITNCKHTVSKLENTTANNTMLFRISTQIYGIDKNIAVKSGSLIAHEAKDVALYDVLFDNAGRTSHTGTTIMHTSVAGASFNFEKCKFVNFETGMEMIKTSANNVTVVLKNTEFEKCNNMHYRFFQLYYNTSSRNRIIFKGENSIHDCISTTDLASSGAAFHFGYSDVIVEEGASFKYYNNQLKTGNRNCIMWFDRSNFTIEKNASFEVYDNLAYQCKVNNEFTAVLCISETSNTINAHGNLKVSGNKIANCTYTTGTYLAAVDLRGGVINIGTGSVIIKDNTSGSNEDGTGEVDDTVRCQHMFNLYAANTNNIFVIKDGLKINPSSRIDATFYDTKDGRIVKWDDTVTDDLNAYKYMFTTDTYGDEEGMEVLLKDGYVVVASRDNEHWHKICGVATDSTCTHTLAAAHTDYHQYTRIHKATTETEFINLIQGASATEEPKYLFLKSNFTITGGKAIELKRNVYLCLNGYSITNAKFTGNGKKIYICNCKEGVVSTIASNQDTNIFARTGIEVYGINKNITISSGRVIDVTDTYNNPTPVFYDINMTGKDSPNPTSNVFEFVKAGANISFEKVNMDNYKSGNKFFNAQANNINLYLKDVSIRNVAGIKDRFWMTWLNASTRNYWHFYGNVTIDNVNITPSADINFLDWSGGTFYIYDKATLSFINCKTTRTIQFLRLGRNGKLNINEGGALIIDNNTLNYVNNQSKAILALTNDSGTELNALGNLQITNNKYVNCAAIAAGGNPTGLRIFSTGKTMKVGSGWMKIYGNKAYKDSSATEPIDDIANPLHHFFEVYSENKNVPIVQQAGTKFNAAESRVENFAFSTVDYTGKIMKWTSNEVDDSYIGRFKDVFKPDAYWDDELETMEGEGYGIIKYGEPKHRHKLCGVSTTSVCLHNNIVSHTEEMKYRKISNMYTSKAEVKSLLQTGGAFVLTYDLDTKSLTGTGNQYVEVTPATDLYICLNGHSLNGFIFLGGANRNVYITNCKTTTATLSNDINAWAMFKNLSGEIYGINKNILVKQDKLAYISGADNQNIRLYSSTYTIGTGEAHTDPYIYLFRTSNQTSFIEDCDFSGMKSSYLLKNETARNYVFKNNTYSDMTLGKGFMDFDGGATNTKFIGINKIEKIKYANSASSYFIRFASYAANDVKIDGDFSITNSESFLNTNHFMDIAGGHFGIEEGASVEITNNTLYNTAIAGRALLYIGSNAHMYLHGSLNISENKFMGTRKSHSDVGLWYANKTEPIEISSRSIVIKNNSTSNAKANVRNLYSYYGGSGAGDGVFVQKAGTLFDAKNSRIDSVAINSEDYTGVVYPYWERAKVKDFDDVYFSEIFKADTYGARKGLLTIRDGLEIIITFGDHFHKLCGTLATESCTHTSTTNHGIGVTPDIMHTYTALRWTDMDNLREKLSLGGDYFLIRKIKFDTPTVIDLQEDLYLCLTGLYIENAIFTSSAGKKAYFTTCIEQIEESEEEEEEEPEYDGSGHAVTPTGGTGSKRNDRHEVAFVATASSAGALFNCGVELYSPYNILKVYANKLYESSGGNGTSIFSGVIFQNDYKTASGGNYIEINGEEELLFDSVEISTMSNVESIVKADNSTLTLTGDTNIFGNELVKFFDVKSIDQKSGSVKLYENLIRREAGEQNLINVTGESHLLGLFEAIDNKIISADDSNNSGLIAIFNIASPGFIHLGNSKLYMDGNTVYSDDGNTLTDLEANQCHYLYGFYSNSFDGMFIQDPSTRIDSTSKVTVSFASPDYHGIVMKSWQSGDIYDSVFKADHNIDGDTGFDRVRMNIALEGSNVILDDRIRIYFKEGKLENKKEGYSNISITHIVKWGEPYQLERVFTWGSRELTSYVDERGVRYRLGMYPKGLILDRGSITLTAQWYKENSKHEIIYTDTKKDEVTIKRDAVIVGGQWVYDNVNGKWMYYFNSYVTNNVIDNLFPNGDSGIHVGTSLTDSRRYLKNGIYQIYYNGQAYFFRFDEKGHMVTGISEANGNQYYFNERGVLEGTMQLNPIVLGSKKIVFDVYGRAVREINEKTGEVTILKSTYQKMVGMEDYYEPIPSLVGWR